MLKQQRSPFIATTRSLYHLALPAMGEQLLQMFMGVIDSYLIARLGLAAVSGVTIAGNILSIYQALFIAIGTATTSLMARSRQHPRQQAVYQGQAVALTVCLGLVLGLLSLFAGSPLLNSLGAPGSVVGSGASYLAIVGGGSLSLGLLTTLGAIARVKGNVRLPLYVNFLTALLNMLLSTVAIMLCHWGLSGVAMATVVSRLIGVLVLATSLEWPTVFQKSSWSLEGPLLALVWPAAGERLMMRAGDVVLVALMTTLGTPVLAGHAIGESLTQVNYMPGLAFATATVILVGQSSEAERRQVIWVSYFWTTLMMLVMSSVVYGFGPWLTGLFTTDPDAAQASRLVLLYAFLGSFATAGTLIYTAVWQGIGEAKRPFYATTIGMWLVRILGSYVLLETTSLGLSAIWLATIGDNLWRFAFLAYSYKRRSCLET